MEVSKKLLYGADSVEPNSVYFSINKPYNIVALNLDNCTAVRFEQAITELAPIPTSTECLCVYNISKPDILGFVPLKCESCNEEDGYVQITADNPSIILELPQNTPLRAYFVNRYTGERLDKPEDLVLLKTQKVSIIATLNVSTEPRTPSAIGCAPFCPPAADWNIDCETKGWTEIPNCYPADWFEEIKSCDGVSSITAKCDGTFETTTTPSEHLGYLLKEPKWWACNAVYSCDGALIGYGMSNQCNDCPPCNPDKVESIIEDCVDPTPPTPRTLYINAKNDPYPCATGNYLCDTVDAFTGTPEIVTIKNIGDLGQGFETIEKSVLAKCGLASIESDDILIAVDDGNTKQFAFYLECENNTLPAGMLDNITRIVYVSCDAKPLIQTCDYEGEVWNNDKLGDNTIFLYYPPVENENYTSPEGFKTWSQLQLTSVDDLTELLSIAQGHIYEILLDLKNNPDAPVYEFATAEELKTYYATQIADYTAEVEAWCDEHNIRGDIDTVNESGDTIYLQRWNHWSAFEYALQDFVDKSLNFIFESRVKSLIKLVPDGVIPKVEITKVNSNTQVSATVTSNTEVLHGENNFSDMIGWKNLLYEPLGLTVIRGYNYNSLKFVELNTTELNIPLRFGVYVDVYDLTHEVCVIRFVVGED